MSKRSAASRVAIGVCLLAFVSGCAKSDGDKPTLASVTGRVTFNNKAVTAATIAFMPDAAKGNRGQMATSVLQLDGSFTMETYPHGAGVMPGSYKVTVLTGQRPEPELQKYRDVNTTPLSIDVPEGGISGQMFELK